MRLAKKNAIAKPRAASTFTPVKKKSTHSRNGHTGTAGAGLKSPGTYHWPNRCARTAALPYHPSSVYFAQSIYHGVWLGKSAARFIACSTANTPITTTQTAYIHLSELPLVFEKFDKDTFSAA